VSIKIKGARAYEKHSALNASFQFKNRPRMAVFEEGVAALGLCSLYLDGLNSKFFNNAVKLVFFYCLFFK
jgi:hypothetical protein